MKNSSCFSSSISTTPGRKKPILTVPFGRKSRPNAWNGRNIGGGGAVDGVVEKIVEGGPRYEQSEKGERRATTME